MATETTELATERQIGEIYWRGEQYFRQSKAEVDQESRSRYGKPVAELTQNEATAFTGVLIMRWVKGRAAAKGEGNGRP